jgi:hypothetical protein
MRPSRRPDARRRRRVLTAFTVLASAALIVSALLLATGEPKVTLVTARPTHGVPPSSTLAVPPGRVSASAATPIEWILLFLAFAAWLWWSWGRSRAPGAAASS